jgi:small subunit ribosomal protein S6
MSKRRCKTMANITNSYETVMILSMNLGEEGINGLITKFKDLIAANGTVEGVDEWGKRKLAYPIQKQPEGYYVLIDFKSAADFTAELDRIYKITDGVLRSLIIKKEEKPAKAKKVVKKAAEATEA